MGHPRGGTGAISEAIGSAARAAGVEIRLESPVERIDVRNGRAKGVVLASGEEIGAGTVLSSVDSHVTFLKLVEESQLDAAFREEVKRYKYRGSSGKVNLALDGAARARVQARRGGVAPRRDQLLAERGLHGARVRRREVRPVLAAAVHRLHHPHARRPSMAPPGKHVMSCFVQYAPYHLEGDKVWTDEMRDAFGETVISTLEERFPNIRSKIVHQQVLTPLDIERITGLTEGNIFQGELSLEQLFFNRPVPGWARYRTPVKDLWMCGSATHPGGGIMGAPGRIAALELMKSQRAGAGRAARARKGRAA